MTKGTCRGHCSFYKKVPMNHPEYKVYCTKCVYNVVTTNTICECCGTKYRTNRAKYNKPTGGKVGRPKKVLVEVKIHPLFDWK